MSSSTWPTPSNLPAPADDSAPVTGSRCAANERLSHLFRTSLRQGRIHPLYLPVLKYRQLQRGV